MTENTNVSPKKAFELYLETRENDVSTSTLNAHRYRLRHFVRWCTDVRSIEAMSELNGRLLHEYRLWRRDDGDLNAVSLRTQLSTLRVFLQFCASIECADGELYDKVQMPTVTPSENQRNTILDSDRATEILSYLERFEYASLNHAILLVLWHTGIRSGSLHSLNLDDYSPTEQWLELQHRPTTDTPLKNGENAQRYVSLSNDVSMVLNDYIAHNRISVTDSNGREPLFTSQYGRYSKTSLRRTLYRLTQPCYISNECPHGKDIESCEHREWADSNLCPSSVAPHDVRRGSITHFLLNDVPAETVSGRMDVSGDVLDQHYDKRSQNQLVEQRREYLNNI